MKSILMRFAKPKAPIYVGAFLVRERGNAMS
nr:MAG TPA: hypothetical protein [Caudoviricetes sp.]